MKPLPQDRARIGWLLRWVAPVVVLLLATGLRLSRLGDANLWWDEALAIWGVRKGLLGVTLWTAGDVHPPLYFWTLWAWVQAVGESEFAMRTVTVFWSVLTVAVVYSFGSMLGGRAVGSLAALLIGLARFHVWWSQEMRMYALAGLMGTLSLYLFVRWLRSVSPPAPAPEPAPPPSGRSEEHTRDGPFLKGLSPRKLLVLYVLASVGAVYTIFLMGATLLVENIIFLVALLGPFGARRRPPLLPWIAAQLAILAALAAWMVLAWGRMNTWSAASPASPLFILHLYATLLATGVSVNIDQVTWATTIPLAVLVLGGVLAVRSWQRRQPGFLPVLTLVLAVLLPAGVIYYATMPRSLFYAPKVEARYFLPFAPAFWLLLAWSIVRIGQARPIAGWGCGVLIVALWIAALPGYYDNRYLRDDLQTMVRTIMSQAEPGDAVLLDSGSRYPLFLYAYDRFPPTLWRPPMIGIPPDGGHLDADNVEPMLAPLVVPYRRLWLAEVDANLSDPQNLAARWLHDHYQEVLTLRYGYNVLHLYDPDGRAPGLQANGYQPQHPLQAATGAGGLLRGWELPVATYTAGDTAHLSLLWDKIPAEPVELTLRSGRGQILAQYRTEPPPGGGPMRQQYDLPIYASTPAGTYDIILSPAPATGSLLGKLQIANTTPLPRVGPPAVALDARLSAADGEQVTLVGYSVRDAGGRKLKSIAPGQSLILDLYWRTDRKLGHEYTVFTHLLGAAHNPKTQGPVWAQHDSLPANNGYPTTQWLSGDTIVDRHTLAVDASAPAGEYRLEVGMYTQDGVRLSVSSPGGESLGDHLLLETAIPATPPR